MTESDILAAGLPSLTCCGHPGISNKVNNAGMAALAADERAPVPQGGDGTITKNAA
jgi:hypothetical protein